MIHDHEQSREWRPNRGQIFTTCYCYCDECYSENDRIYKDNGCICVDCFCREEQNIGSNHKWHGPPQTNPDFLPIRKPTETVIRDLPEHPGKTGTCRKCKGPTYRNGNRGRFPVICEGCK